MATNLSLSVRLIRRARSGLSRTRPLSGTREGRGISSVGRSNINRHSGMRLLAQARNDGEREILLRLHPTTRRANHQNPVQPPLQKYFRSHPAQITFMSAPSGPERGALAIVTNVGTGCGGRGGAFDEQRQCGRRSRVVLTPRRRRQVLEKQASQG